MRVKVNLSNILEYGLDTLTGNSRADLLEAAARAVESGEEMYVVIPDAEGGDTEAPVERNSFEHFSDLPDPEGPMHPQEVSTQSISHVVGRAKLHLTQQSVDALKTMALADGLTEVEWDYWLSHAVEIIENPYGH